MKYNYATLVNARRINASTYGNPNYELTLDPGDGMLFLARSSSDSSWCYAYDECIWMNKSVRYTTTRAGRIDTMEPLKIEHTFTDKELIGQV